MSPASPLGRNRFSETDTSQSLLAAQQSARLQSLAGKPQLSHAQAVAQLPVVQHRLSPRGLEAYRVNAHGGAHRALQACFPVLEHMLGAESLPGLAHGFWHHAPPIQGDWAQWGAGLPAYLRQHEALEPYPWLSDVARIEWLLHRLASAADSPFVPTSLQLLTEHDPQELFLRLAAHEPVWTSPWPVVSLVLAHNIGSPEGVQADEDLLEEARCLLALESTQEVLCWRQGWRPRVRQALPHEARFLAALQDGNSLGTALQASPELDFSQWLQTAVETQLLRAVEHPTLSPTFLRRPS